MFTVVKIFYAIGVERGENRLSFLNIGILSQFLFPPLLSPYTARVNIPFFFDHALRYENVTRPTFNVFFCPRL